MITLNGEQIKPTLFPDGTSQVWNIELDILSKNVQSKEFNIDWDFTHEGELIQLYQLVDLLKTLQPKYKVNLNMDFLPYSRQDKSVTNSSTFALHTFARILNSMHLDNVTSLDTHNADFATWNIDNFKNLFPYTQIAATKKEVNPDVLCFPDRGALSRYGKELAFLGVPYVWAEKERDQSTGHISKIEIKGDNLLQDSNVLMVDDICDGGMTFILLAQELYKAGARKVNLYTTHGIYSKGLKPLREAKIDRIFNKNGEVGELQGQIVEKKI